MIDKGTPEFEDACKELIERAGNVQGRTENANIGLNGRWTATMEKFRNMLCRRFYSTEQMQSNRYIFMT